MMPIPKRLEPLPEIWHFFFMLIIPTDHMQVFKFLRLSGKLCFRDGEVWMVKGLTVEIKLHFQIRALFQTLNISTF